MYSLFSSGIWIVLLIIVLFSVLIYKEYYFIYYKGIAYSNYEEFMSYPQTTDITKVIQSNPDTNTANTSYKQILNYIQKNPKKSIRFIEDVKNKFFEPSCQVKSNINFNNLISNSMSSVPIF